MSKKLSKPMWTDREKGELERRARSLEKELGRPLRPRDLRKVKLRGRSFHAVRNQAARMGLYDTAAPRRRWSVREEQMLVLLARQRSLGARSIKSRGFFSTVEATAPQGPPAAARRASWGDRSVDAIAQKIRRSGLADPERSRRARYARRLSREERAQLRRELKENPRRWTTEQFSAFYDVAPSTIRRYRKKWRIRHSWRDAMDLPAAKARRERAAEETRERNLAAWERRKARLLADLLALAKKLRSRKRPPPTRTCQRCGREWPATEDFFALSPKRCDGDVVRRYLRRTCRICPRRQTSAETND